MWRKPFAIALIKPSLAQSRTNMAFTDLPRATPSNLSYRQNSRSSLPYWLIDGPLLFENMRISETLYLSEYVSVCVPWKDSPRSTAICYLQKRFIAEPTSGQCIGKNQGQGIERGTNQGLTLILSEVMIRFGKIDHRFPMGTSNDFYHRPGIFSRNFRDQPNHGRRIDFFATTHGPSYGNDDSKRQTVGGSEIPS